MIYLLLGLLIAVVGCKNSSNTPNLYFGKTDTWTVESHVSIEGKSRYLTTFVQYTGEYPINNFEVEICYSDNNCSFAKVRGAMVKENDNYEVIDNYDERIRLPLYTKLKKGQTVKKVIINWYEVNNDIIHNENIELNSH